MSNFIHPTRKHLVLKAQSAAVKRWSGAHLLHMHLTLTSPTSRLCYNACYVTHMHATAVMTLLFLVKLWKG